MKSQPKHPWCKKSCSQESKKRLCYCCHSNVLRTGHHYQKFKFHQQQEALAAHFDFTSFSAQPFFRFLAATFFTPGVFWLRSTLQELLVYFNDSILHLKVKLMPYVWTFSKLLIAFSITGYWSFGVTKPCGHGLNYTLQDDINVSVLIIIIVYQSYYIRGPSR